MSCGTEAICSRYGGMGEDRYDQLWQSRRADPRKVLIARVEARWDDETGRTRIAPAMIEDISRGGVAIRLREPLGVGLTIRIKAPREEFSGVVRHCRRDGHEYLIGIQRLAQRASD